ncbi:MAG: N-acetylmuramoyl-L-alanine amidase [Rickettsiales bacterium]|nr:N-acetylmuramoyl-L-alanine amidase [Rickettsiales bacterium]OUV79000.1 MAG: hypothetical protein CBC91_04350 [Rickettsiales bacterium TMED131]|tara:strand:+ start:76 stop:819 length:744 start_codon:yes stop_codon:yes gene_type:complete
MKKQKKINFINELSPNFSIRKNKIKYIILHYTGTNKLSETLSIFNDPNSKVSCHWLISSRGILYKIVEEKNTAWHAGISYWKNKKLLNNESIGIELQNNGHGLSYKKFPSNQILKLEVLLKNILEKYKIDKRNVLAHSDIAPERKLDPGELFDWSNLAKKQLAYFPAIKKYSSKKKFFFHLGQVNNDIYFIKKMLSKIGYKCTKNNIFDIYLKLVIEAFQRRFLPERINGIIDEKVYNRIIEVSKNT